MLKFTSRAIWFTDELERAGVRTWSKRGITAAEPRNVPERVRKPKPRRGKVQLPRQAAAA